MPDERTTLSTMSRFIKYRSTNYAAQWAHCSMSCARPSSRARGLGRGDVLEFALGRDRRSGRRSLTAQVRLADVGQSCAAEVTGSAKNEFGNAIRALRSLFKVKEKSPDEIAARLEKLRTAGLGA